VTVSSVLGENAWEPQLHIIKLQTDLSLKTRVNNAGFRNFVPSAQGPSLK
jgi:hypothetical protein